MQLKKKEIEIIKLLISSPTYVTTYDISATTNINRRLVREYIPNIKAFLSTCGFVLLSKPSKGYMIQEKSSSLQYLQSLIEDIERNRDTLHPTLPYERQCYILKRLIDLNNYIKIDTLADELLFSRSTISNDLIYIKKDTLLKYHLSLKQKPNYGICIDGEEIHKRQPLCDFLFTNFTHSQMLYDFLDTFFSNPEDYHFIEIINKYNIDMSDIALSDFLISLSVCIERINKGYTIDSEIHDFNNYIDRIEYIAAKELASYIEERFKIIVNQYEIQHIAILLICKRSTTRMQITKDEKIIHLVQNIFDEIQKQTLITFDNNNFKRIFSLHVEAALIRQKYLEKIRHPLYLELKTCYPLAYELALITSSIIEKYSKTPLSRSELSNFTVIFNNVIFGNSLKRKQTLIINDISGSMTNLSINLIMSGLNPLSSYIDIKEWIQYYKLPLIDLKQFDLIISTIPIHRKLPIPHINISHMITQEDIDKIDSYLKYNSINKQFKFYFHPKLFKSHVKVKTKKGISTEIYKLINYLYPNIKDSFKNIIMNSNSYDFQVFKEIGLIQLNKPFNNNNNIVILIFENPILFDNHNIQILILFSCFDSNYYIYNTLMSALKNLSLNSKAYQNIIENPDYVNMLQTLIDHQ
jgi:Transcriptional antiterminator